MSLGLITVVEEVSVQGPTRTLRCTVVGDGAYPTGGTPSFQALFRAATLGAGVISAVKGATVVDVRSLNVQGGTVIDGELHYDHVTDTLASTVKSTAAEVANATDLSGNTYHCLIQVK